MDYNICPELSYQDKPVSKQFPQFVFKGKCPIETCQYNTSKTQNGCLALDRKESADRPISAKELHYYKLSDIEEFSTFDSKQIETIVKRTQNKSKLIIALHSYVSYLNHEDLDKTMQEMYRPKVYPLVDMTHSYLRQTFPEYETWMLKYMSDEVLFGEVTQSFTKSDLSLGQALLMTPKKYALFCSLLESYERR